MSRAGPLREGKNPCPMYHIPYHGHPGFRPLNELVPGNNVADDPVEFDLAPAWGPDLARIRSIITASPGPGPRTPTGPRPCRRR
jgi:hypothetical protein